MESRSFPFSCDEAGRFAEPRAAQTTANRDNEFPVFTGPIDEIGFEYNGNQMRNAWDNLDDQDILNTTTNDFRDNYVEGVTENYLYDANGNQYADLNKGIAWIQYNSLNLPSKMQFSNGNKNEYLYDASGVKHRATYSYAVNLMQIPLGATTTENTGTNLLQSSYTDYCGNYVYENGKIKRILTPEGYIEAAGAIPMNYIPSWSYNYLLKDHLGNTRQRLISNYISLKSPILNSYASSNCTIDYYPFGMEMLKMYFYDSGYSIGTMPGTVTPYLYNGKEMDRMNGLNEYDYGARWRDPTVGNGWNTVDPLCEMKPWQSPYMYCSGNPVNRTDPTGMDDINGGTLSGVTVTAPALNDNNNINYNFGFLQMLDDANRNTPQISRITPPTPTFNLPTNTTNMTNENQTKPKDKKLSASLKRISAQLYALGLTNASVTVIETSVDGVPTISVLFKGGAAFANLARLAPALKALGPIGFALNLVVDAGKVTNNDESKLKAGVNTAVGVVSLWVPEVGLVYMILDHYGAFDGAPTNLPNYQRNNGICPQDAIKTVIPNYTH